MLVNQNVDLNPSLSGALKDLERDKYDNLKADSIPVDIRNNPSFWDAFNKSIPFNPDSINTKDILPFIDNNKKEEIEPKEILGIPKVLFFSAVGGVLFITTLYLLKR